MLHIVVFQVLILGLCIAHQRYYTVFVHKYYLGYDLFTLNCGQNVLLHVNHNYCICIAAVVHQVGTMYKLI